MSPQIRILSDLTINQIAAGEVIENPASVVKELVENAIDAGCRHLKVEILGGGFQLIRIVDDGFGMSAEDALLSLERHATSKIIQADDLFSLQTMGFRGEALASIAAISKMRICTALENTQATDVEVEGGKILRVIPAARSQGTTIEVRSLFYNVPARQKFQKSPASSSAEITKMITQLSLSHPEVGFELIQQNRSHFSLPATSGEEFLTVLKMRCNALLSSEFVPSCRDFHWQEKEIQGTGLLADPAFARHNRSGQYLFVNRRPVYCPGLGFAIRDAYGTRLDSNRHPVYLLHLRIAPHLIDVNVHPQKKEIRLRDESVLKYALHSAVNKALESSVSRIESKEADVSFSSFFQAPTYSIYPQPMTFKEDAVPLLIPELPIETPIRSIGVYEKYMLVDAKTLPSSLFPEMEKKSLGMVWIDLIAAQMRIQFDTLIKNAATSPLSQGLLFPISLQFSKAETQKLQEHLEALQQLGMQIRPSSDKSFIIDAIPPFLDETEVHSVFLEILDIDIKNEGQLRTLAATLSRRIHRRGAFSLDEGHLIVRKLMHSTDPLQCPRGKKILFHMREDAIEHFFK